MISQSQFDAGERLRADFWFAQMTPRTTMNWSSSAPMQRGRRYGATRAAGADMRDATAAAGERVRRALAAVGPELSGVLIDVCCHLKGLEAAERAAGWPQRSGKIVLQLALTSLARHYGLEKPAAASGNPPACAIGAAKATGRCSRCRARPLSVRPRIAPRRRSRRRGYAPPWRQARWSAAG